MSRKGRAEIVIRERRWVGRRGSRKEGEYEGVGNRRESREEVGPEVGKERSRER